MIALLQKEHRQSFFQLCALEEVFGSRALTALELYGADHPVHRFYLSQNAQGKPDAALHLNGQVLTVISGGGPDLHQLAGFIRQQGVLEVDTTEDQAQALQKELGGELEASYFMEYPLDTPPAAPREQIAPTQDPRAVYEVLRQSHEYYRDHLDYGPWAQDLLLRWERGLACTVLLTEGGRPVGTGSIISTSPRAGAIAAVAVIPECRGRGCGTALSAWLTRAVGEMGKRPVLISGYDAVAAIYRGLGYRETGRWGELYL